MFAVCLLAIYGITVSATTSLPPTINSPPPSTTSSNGRGTLDAITLLLLDLTKEVRELKGEVGDLQQTTSYLQGKGDAMQQQITLLLDDNVELQKKYSYLEAEAASLQVTTSALEDDAAAEEVERKANDQLINTALMELDEEFSGKEYYLFYWKFTRVITSIKVQSRSILHSEPGKLVP